MNGDTLVVMTTQGSLRVEGGGVSREIPQGQMITLHSLSGCGTADLGYDCSACFHPRFEDSRDFHYWSRRLAVLINHLINTNAQTQCEALKEFNPPTSTLPANCR